jgi:hypothetical protein
MNRLLVTRVGTVPVSLDIVADGMRQVVHEVVVEHDDILRCDGPPHIGRMERVRAGDPLPACGAPLVPVRMA